MTKAVANNTSPSKRTCQPKPCQPKKDKVIFKEVALITNGKVKAEKPGLKGRLSKRGSCTTTKAYNSCELMRRKITIPTCGLGKVAK